jgi:hypothetical protein
MTVFFIDPQPHLESAPPQTPRIARRAGRSVERELLRESPSLPNTDSTSAATSEDSSAAPTIDWSAERERSVADILDHGQPDQAVAGSPAPPMSAGPWDPHANLFETNGHGFTVRIPVEIAGKIIDHYFGVFDLGQNQGGKWEKYQLGCILRKQPARGDLFDFLRPPAEPQK